MTTKITAHFTLTGRFDPHQVTEYLGITPDRTWRYNEAIQGTLLRYKHDGWRLSTVETESFDAEEQILTVLNRIRPHIVGLAELCRSLALDVEMGCVVSVEGVQTPAIHISRKTIRQLSELDADVDIDLYVK